MSIVVDRRLFLRDAGSDSSDAQPQGLAASSLFGLVANVIPAKRMS
jgi:hypothetical protein